MQNAYMWNDQDRMDCRSEFKISKHFLTPDAAAAAAEAKNSVEMIYERLINYSVTRHRHRDRRLATHPAASVQRLCTTLTNWWNYVVVSHFSPWVPRPVLWIESSTAAGPIPLQPQPLFPFYRTHPLVSLLLPSLSYFARLLRTSPPLSSTTYSTLPFFLFDGQTITKYTYNMLRIYLRSNDR